MNPQLSKLCRRLVATIAMLMLASAWGVAATNPLNNPRGLAVDSKGNLWVANPGDNNVIVFNPSYNRITADTITQGISIPTGVAFDPLGNLWVANYGAGNGGPDGSITEYTGTKQGPGVIINGIQAPNAIAIDGLGDIWVQNDYVNVTIYIDQIRNPGYFAQTYNPPGLSSVYGIAAAGPWMVFGENGGIDILATSSYFLEGANPNEQGQGNEGFAVASGADGTVYYSNFDNTVSTCNVSTVSCSGFLTLPFTAAGIAVDNARTRVYFSNENGNEILVYSTKGVLLHTID